MAYNWLRRFGTFRLNWSLYQANIVEQLYRWRPDRFCARTMLHGIVLLNQFKSDWRTISSNVSAHFGSTGAFIKQALCAHSVCLIKAPVEPKRRDQLCAILT